MSDIFHYFISCLRLCQVYLGLNRLGNLSLAVLLCNANITARGACSQAHHCAHISKVGKVLCKLQLDILSQSLPLVNHLM